MFLNMSEHMMSSRARWGRYSAADREESYKFVYLYAIMALVEGSVGQNVVRVTVVPSVPMISCAPRCQGVANRFRRASLQLTHDEVGQSAKTIIDENSDERRHLP